MNRPVHMLHQAFSASAAAGMTIQFRRARGVAACAERPVVATGDHVAARGSFCMAHIEFT
jgi:hypothetical protein